jgi:hypothetical protein
MRLVVVGRIIELTVKAGRKTFNGLEGSGAGSMVGTRVHWGRETKGKHEGT